MMLMRSMSKPGPKALVRLNQPMRYSKGKIDFEVWCSSDFEFRKELREYVDSDFAGNQEETSLTMTDGVFHMLSRRIDRLDSETVDCTRSRHFDDWSGRRGPLYS